MCCKTLNVMYQFAELSLHYCSLKLVIYGICKWKMLGVSSILTKSIIQHKFYIDIRIKITHNISIISPNFVVASFINERCFKTYNIVQYSPENNVLNASDGHTHFGWAEILVRMTGNWWNGCTNGQRAKKIARSSWHLQWKFILYGHILE